MYRQISACVSIAMSQNHLCCGPFVFSPNESWRKRDMEDRSDRWQLEHGFELDTGNRT